MPSSPPAPNRASDRRQRLVTGVVAAGLVLAACFLLPSDAWFALCVAGCGAAAVEFASLARNRAPTAPLGVLILLVPLAAVGLFLLVRRGTATAELGLWLLVAGGVLAATSAVAPLLAGTAVRDATAAIGLVAFGVPYFAVPAVALYWLQAADPWLVFLLLGIVALGDTAAYFVGSRLGRHKMAPRVSPNKSWEGAAAGFLTALAATALWSVLRLGEVRGWILAIAAGTAVAAQLGDLVESLLKRDAGVKDSSRLLPGHGGLFDRLDATLLAAPVLAVGLWLLGVDGVTPEG